MPLRHAWIHTLFSSNHLDEVPDLRSLRNYVSRQGVHEDDRKMRCNSYLDGVLPLGVVDLPLASLVQYPLGVGLGQAAADGASLLRPQVKGQVLLVLVEQTELSPLLQVDDGQDTGDRLAEVGAVVAETLACDQTSGPNQSRAFFRDGSVLKDNGHLDLICQTQ